MNVWPVVIDSPKITWPEVWAVCRLSSTSHCMAFSQFWFPKSVGHMGMGIVMWQVDAICEFTRHLFLILVHRFWSILWQSLHHLCKYVMWSSEVQCLEVSEHSQLHFMLSWFTFLWSGWGGVLPLLACFSAPGFKITTPCLIAHHSSSQKHVILNVLLWMFKQYWHAVLFVCVCH